MNRIITKAILGFLIFLMIFALPGLFLKTEKKANAVLALLPMQVVQYAIQAWGYLKEAYNFLYEKMSKVARDILAKRIIDYVVDQTVKWVQGGGKPKFVTDWNGFLKDAGNIAFDQVIKDVGASRLCSPFSLQVKVGLLPVKRFGDQISCTLDDVVKNINDFYTNFEKGGWIAYNEAWQPQNNYYGQQIMIQDQIQIETSKKVTAATNEAVSGKGFLGQKKCVKYEDVSESELVACENESYDESGGFSTLLYEGCVNRKTANAKCLKEEIVTPGDTVGAVVAKGMTSDIEWAANIQSWMSALVNAVINRLFTEGLSALKGSSSGGGGGSYYPPEMSGLVDAELKQQQQEILGSVKKINDEWQYILNAKSKALDYANQELAILNNLKTKNCQPPVSDAQIATLQSSIELLKNQISDLTAKTNEAKALIAEINAAKTTAALTRVLQKANEFMAKYNTEEMQRRIYDGDNRVAADTEANKFRNDLQDAQNRLNVCIASSSG